MLKPLNKNTYVKFTIGKTRPRRNRLNDYRLRFDGHQEMNIASPNEKKRYLSFTASS